MPFLKVLPEKEEDQVKFIEVSAVYEPEKQEESNEAIIDAAQEITPTQQIDSPESIQESPLTEPEPITPEESESEQDDTPPLVDDIDIIDETITQPATEPTQESPVTESESITPPEESPGIEPVTQEPTQENTHESEPMPEPVDEQREQEEAAPVESTPPEQTNESESTQDTLPAPVDNIDIIDETINETVTEPTQPEESQQSAQDDTHALVDEPIMPPNESNESKSTQDPPPASVDNIDIIDETTPPDEPPEPTPIDTGNKYTGEDIKYDVTSGKRYVDLVSTKTDFDRMLDELAAISKDIIEHEAERFAKKYTGKFQGGFDKAEADAKKYDAFLGGYITNAAMLLYDRGHREVAISKLEETRKVLEARKRLEDETAAIKTRVEEEDAVVDLSDILGLFGDG